MTEAQSPELLKPLTSYQRLKRKLDQAQEAKLRAGHSLVAQDRLIEQLRSENGALRDSLAARDRAVGELGSRYRELGERADRQERAAQRDARNAETELVGLFGGAMESLGVPVDYSADPVTLALQYVDLVHPRPKPSLIKRLGF